jgi:hypothetical protein
VEGNANANGNAVPKSVTSEGGHLMSTEDVTHNCTLQEALRLVTKAYMGNRGLFALEAFDFINASYFDGKLPQPLILWGLTAHGSCLGLTQVRERPVIQLHPSLLGGTEKQTPWNMPAEHLGRLAAFEVLVHECIHVSVSYVLGGWHHLTGAKSAHNNPLWVAEVNRLAPLLGLPPINAGMSRLKRVRESDTGPGKVRRVNDGDMPLFYHARFPYGVRQFLGLTDACVANELPF